jgi:hypothetical protein
MLGIALITAAGGLLTITFAYWSMKRIVNEPVKAAIAPVTAAGAAVAATSQHLQQATEKVATDPTEANTNALKVATDAHTSAAQAVAALGPLTGTKEVAEGIGSIFKDLGALSPPIAALCIALLMFLAAGGIEFAGIVK